MGEGAESYRDSASGGGGGGSFDSRDCSGVLRVTPGVE